MAMSRNIQCDSDEAYHENERQLKDRKEKRKLHRSSRHSRDKFQERLDFKFYDFKALEIEKGWNQLFVSIISIETGETIAKSGKALVKNGECDWEDSMLSTIWISDYSLQDNQACLLKLLVAMGSPRFGTLGEATINLASYIGQETFTASLPLIQHCSRGAILQVKIQCLTPRRNYRKDVNSYGEEVSVGYDDVDSISHASDTTFSRTSVSSSHCDHSENIFYPGELGSKRRGPLTTCSDHDIGSLESSLPSWIENLTQQSNVNGWKTNVQERQDLTCSKDGPYSLDDTSMLKHASSTSETSSLGTEIQHDKMEDFGKVPHAGDTASTTSVCSSKDMLGAAQVTIELLHGEVKMWEEGSRKLMTDVDRLRKELQKKSKHKKDLEMELSASRKESSDLKEEIQRLTAMVKQNGSRNHRLQIEEKDNIIKELKDEISYQKGLNHDLEVKLNKTQESNIDIVSIFRNFEKKVEKQKMEIARLSRISIQFQDAENNSRGTEDSEEEDFSLSIEAMPQITRKEFGHSGFDFSTNENAIRCLHEGIELQEFRNMEIERQVMREKQKSMQSTIQFLEKTLDEKDQKMQTATRHFMAQTLEENEAKWRNRLFEKEKQITNFEKKLYGSVNAFSNEILALTQRVQDLEAEFRKRHGESKEDLVVSGSFPSNSLLYHFDTAINITEAFLELYKQLLLSVENLKDQDSPKNESCFNISELSKVAGKMDLKELTEGILCTIIQLTKLLESKAASFENEMNPHNEVRNLSELESSDDNQHALFELEAEVAQLSEQISGLEAEVRHLNEEKALTHLALENSENIVIYLQAEIRRMENLNEGQKIDLKIMGESIQKKWTEAQEECDFLKGSNLKLQATNENLIQVSKTLQMANGELRMQNFALHNRYTVLESKLGESQITFSDIMKFVEDLECKFTSILEEIALKEKTINVDLEALLQESIKQNERFTIEERFLTQMYMEKAAEVSNLQREVEHLTDQISDIYDRHNIIASKVVLDVYDLCADKAMTESALQEEQEKVKLYEAKLDNLHAEYEITVHNYNKELAAMREKHETLMVNHEKTVVLLGNSKSNEEKLKGIVRGLEVELKDSELERLQATEEISELEVQLQKTVVLQNELFILKKSLYEAEIEYRRLEASYQILSLEYNVLKAEKVSYMQRVLTTEKITSEFEDCKRSKVELEDKIFRLEWDRTTKEASWRNNAQLKYELAQVTRENGELSKKKDSLQQESEEYQKKVKALEEKLKQKDDKQDQFIDKDRM